MKRFRPGPLLLMSLALVALAGSIVLLADLLLGVIPDHEAAVRANRKAFGESMAVQAATLLQQDELVALEKSLATVLQRTPDLRSMALRRSGGAIVLMVGDHRRHWHSDSGSQRSSLEHVTIPLDAGATRWGSFEMAFAPDGRSWLVRWMHDPMVMLLCFIAVVGSIVFALYLRRALQHLDPASVVPDRVQGAFDAMHEGVVVLDARGRVLLANRAFRALHPEAEALRVGQNLSGLRWIAAGLPGDVAQHPWTRAMSDRRATTGDAIEVGKPEDPVCQLVVNTSPISDPGGRIRGCLTTFNDVSGLHRANEALRDSLADLSRVRDEMERKNVELERLSTRDPLSGCLNRRAFFEEAESRFIESRSHGTGLACLMVDIDHFKSVNDTFGHGIGDRVIQGVAARLMAGASPLDLVCRYGGEEFCMLLPEADASRALQLAESVRTAIEDTVAGTIPEATGLRLTASIGVGLRRAGHANLTALIEEADRALYNAKRNGRNRVSRASDAGRDAGARRTASADC